MCSASVAGKRHGEARDDSNSRGMATCACHPHPGLTLFPSLMLSSSAPARAAKAKPPSSRRRSLKSFLHLPSTNLSSQDANAGVDVPAPSSTANSTASSATVITSIAHSHTPPDVFLTIAALLSSADVVSFSMTVCTPRRCPPVTETLSYQFDFSTVFRPPRSPRSSPIQHCYPPF